jgi:hypothetical protein
MNHTHILLLSRLLFLLRFKRRRLRGNDDVILSTCPDDQHDDQCDNSKDKQHGQQARQKHDWMYETSSHCDSLTFTLRQIKVSAKFRRFALAVARG